MLTDISKRRQWTGDLTDTSKRKSRTMHSPPLPILSLFLLLFLAVHPRCDAAVPLTKYCGTDRKITRAASANIARVLASLLSETPSKGFSTASYGSGHGDRAYGLAQCRQDVSVEDCRTCLRDSAAQLPKLCRGGADARVWFDYCFLRYGTRPFAGELDTAYGLFYINVQNVTEDAAEQRRFDRELGSLMSKIQTQAPARGSRGLAKLQTKFTPFVTIYALAQCTQDLPPLACAQCISIAVANFPVLCPHRKGCRALYSSCYVRYEIYPFFFPVPAGSSAAAAAAAAVSSVSVVVYP